MENYTIKEQNGTASNSGSTSGPSGILYYFIAEAESGYMFKNPKIITSDENAVVNISNTSDTSVLFSVMTSIGTTIVVEGVTQITIVSYAPLNIEVTNTISEPDNVTGIAEFNIASTMQLGSYPILRFNTSSTGQTSDYIVAGFGDDTTNTSSLKVGYKGGSYNPNTSSLWCPAKDTLGEFDSIDVTMYGDIQDTNLSTISKTQNIYATILNSAGNEIHRSNNTITINGHDTHSSETLYTLYFDELVSFDSTQPLILHYEII